MSNLLGHSNEQASPVNPASEEAKAHDTETLRSRDCIQWLKLDGAFLIQRLPSNRQVAEEPSEPNRY
jgi:hypothetical protein